MADLNRQDIIREMVSEVDGLSHAMASASLEALISCIDRALLQRQTVVISGFGKFGVRYRRSRQGVNPRTHNAMEVPAAVVPYFTPSPILKNRINTTARSAETKPT